MAEVDYFFNRTKDIEKTLKRLTPDIKKWRKENVLKYLYCFYIDTSIKSSLTIKNVYDLQADFSINEQGQKVLDVSTKIEDLIKYLTLRTLPEQVYMPSILR